MVMRLSIVVVPGAASPRAISPDVRDRSYPREDGEVYGARRLAGDWIESKAPCRTYGAPGVRG